MSAMDNLSELRTFINSVPQVHAETSNPMGQASNAANLDPIQDLQRLRAPIDPVDELLAGQVPSQMSVDVLQPQPQPETWVGGRVSSNRNNIDTTVRASMLNSMDNTLNELNAMIGGTVTEPALGSNMPEVELDIPVQIEKQPSLVEQLADVSVSAQRPPVQAALRRRKPKNEESANNDFMDDSEKVQNTVNNSENEKQEDGNQEDDTSDNDEPLESVKKSQVVAIVASILVVLFIIIIFFFKGLFSKNEDTAPKQTQSVAQGNTIPQPTTAVISQRNLERGTLLANTQMNFDTTVYTDTMLVNKFIEIRGGVALFKFKGIPKHFNTEIEFIVSGDDYNRYANGVQITIKYKVISIDGVDYVFDVQLGEQT